MKTSKALQDMLTATAQQFDFDLNEVEIAYRLEDKSGYTITIERENDNFLLIGEYKDFQAGKLDGDLEFLIFTRGVEWMPVGFSQAGSGSVWGAVISTDGKELLFVIPQPQAEIAEKCEAWVQQLMGRNGYDGNSGFLTPIWIA